MQESALLARHRAHVPRGAAATLAATLARRLAAIATDASETRCARNNFAVVREIFAIAISRAASRASPRAPRGRHRVACAGASDALRDARRDDARENFLRLIVDSVISRV